MTLNEILDSITTMEPRAPDVAQAPPKELIAFFVRWVRQMRQWKQQTLASFAGVSLSTVERVERAERVSSEKLDRIAVGLGYDAGYLTRARLPLPSEEAITKVIDLWGNLEPVPVRRLNTDSQIRRLGTCHGYLFHRVDELEDADELIGELREWLCLASFIIGCPDVVGTAVSRRRTLYGHIRECVKRIESIGLNVLGGIMEVPQPGMPDWKVAVIAISPKQQDPGACKRRHILVDRRHAMAPADWPVAPAGQ